VSATGCSRQFKVPFKGISKTPFISKQLLEKDLRTQKDAIHLIHEEDDFRDVSLMKLKRPLNGDKSFSVSSKFSHHMAPIGS
jgi:hypothetical protein